MLPDVSVLLPYIQAGRRNVGRHRTSARDISRILMDHGARTLPARFALADALSEAFPPPANQAELRATYQRLARQYAVSCRVLGLQPDGSNGPDRGRTARPNHDAATHEHWRVMRQMDAAAAAANSHHALIRDLERVWWAEMYPGVEALCDAEAERILAERDQ